MGRLFKWLVYLILLAGIGLLAYAYLGPVFDSGFAPEPEEIRIPVELDAG